MNHDLQRDALNLLRPELRRIVLREIATKLHVSDFMSPHSQPMLHACYVEFEGGGGGFQSRILIDSREIPKNADRLADLIEAKGSAAGDMLIETMLMECEFASDVRGRWWFRLHTTLERWGRRILRR